MIAYLKSLLTRLVTRVLIFLRLKVQEEVVPTVDAALQNFIKDLQHLQEVAEHHEAIEVAKRAEAAEASAQSAAAYVEADRARRLAQRFSEFLA